MVYWEGSMSTQYALQGKNPAHTLKTTISGLTLETQGTISVSTAMKGPNCEGSKTTQYAWEEIPSA